MSSSDSPDDDARDDGPVPSSEAVTPRGGFMARPGLKPPPRHAVVVRVGDAPQSEHIPVARSSIPPPPPSEPAPLSPSEKITARAIPKPSTPPPPPVTSADTRDERRNREQQLTIPSTLPGELARLHAPESSPPPSDAPLVSSVRDTEPPQSRRLQASRWPIVAAAAAGLLLGLASVATRVHQRRAAAPLPAVTLDAATLPSAQAAKRFEPAQRAALRAQSEAAPSARDAQPKERAPQPVRPAAPSAKRSIF